jgi:hypothetical protein
VRRREVDISRLVDDKTEGELSLCPPSVTSNRGDFRAFIDKWLQDQRFVVNTLRKDDFLSLVLSGFAAGETTGRRRL